MLKVKWGDISIQKKPFIFQIKVNPATIIAIKLITFGKKGTNQSIVLVCLALLGIEKFSPKSDASLQSKLSKRSCFHKKL